VQVSPGGHARQALPPLPHEVVLVPDSQTPAPLQHPRGQVAALQGRVRQMPPEQMSSGGQSVHALPPVPQAVGLRPGSQKPRGSQQPLGQVAASHAGPLHFPAEQVSLGGQGRHAAPPVPHSVVLVPGWQFPALSQHPVGQLDALQVVPWHEPPAQVSPPGQGAQALPSLPHALVLVPVSQAPATSQQPVGHVAALHGRLWQVWEVGSQTSPVVAQSMQRAPPAPQSSVSRPPRHCSPPAPLGAQHPFGQLVASHPAVTPTHAWVAGLHEVKPSAVQFSHACAPSPQTVSDVPLWH
jgi:hypothetical protein